MHHRVSKQAMLRSESPPFSHSQCCLVHNITSSPATTTPLFSFQAGRSISEEQPGLEIRPIDFSVVPTVDTSCQRDTRLKERKASNHDIPKATRGKQINNAENTEREAERILRRNQYWIYAMKFRVILKEKIIPPRLTRLQLLF